MQSAPEAVSRGPPVNTYVVDGQSFYNIHQAAKIIGTITDRTLRKWAKAGRTPFGYEITTRCVPMVYRARSFRHDAKVHRGRRRLIAAAEVEVLKKILNDDPIRPGILSHEQMLRLEGAARRYRSLHH
jgi:hypothetical protein